MTEAESAGLLGTGWIEGICLRRKVSEMKCNICCKTITAEHLLLHCKKYELERERYK